MSEKLQDQFQCSTPRPASLPGRTPCWFQTILKEAIPELRVILYDLEVHQPKTVFERHAKRVYSLISAFEIALDKSTQVQDKDEYNTLQDHFAAIAMQPILAASHPASCIVDYNDIACRAYLMARAMMRRRAMMHSG